MKTFSPLVFLTILFFFVTCRSAKKYAYENLITREMQFDKPLDEDDDEDEDFLPVLEKISPNNGGVYSQTDLILVLIFKAQGRSIQSAP